MPATITCPSASRRLCSRGTCDLPCHKRHQPHHAPAGAGRTRRAHRHSPCKRAGRRGGESGPGIGLPDSMVPGCLLLARIRRKCELQDGAATPQRNPRLSRHRRRYRMHSGWDNARCTLRITNLCGPSFPRSVTRNADHQRGLGCRIGCGPWEAWSPASVQMS